MFIICVAESRTKENACYVSVSNVSVCLCIEHAVSECVRARLLIAGPAIRDCQGISKLHIIQLILPYTISCIRFSSEIPLLSLLLMSIITSRVDVVKTGPVNFDHQKRLKLAKIKKTPYFYGKNHFKGFILEMILNY